MAAGLSLTLVLAACGGVQPDTGEATDDVTASAGAAPDAEVAHDHADHAHDEKTISPMADESLIDTSWSGAKQVAVDAAEKEYGVRLCTSEELSLQEQTPADAARYDATAESVDFAFVFTNTTKSTCAQENLQVFEIFGPDDVLLMAYVNNIDCGDARCFFVAPGAEHTATLAWNLMIFDEDTNEYYRAPPGRYTVRLTTTTPLLVDADLEPVMTSDADAAKRLSRTTQIQSTFTVES